MSGQWPQWLLFIWNFQTLVVGIFATGVAFVTAIIIYRSATIPIETQKEKEARDQQRFLRLQSLVLSEEYKLISKRARGIEGTVTVHKASNASVSDVTKSRMKLEVPQATRDWHYLSLLPEEVARKCLTINAMIEDHNFDIERAGGAFGDDNFGRLIQRRANSISKTAEEVSAKLSSFEIA